MSSLMRIGKVSGVLCLLFGLAACGGDTDDGFAPPKVGTQFAWKYVSEDAVDDDLVTVVATGPDFAIFQQSLDGSYYAEFSAIGFSSCEEDDQPSGKDREAVLSAWPLTVGTEIGWKTDTILIEREDVTKFGDQEEPVFWFVHDYADIDSDNDQFAISPRYGTSLEIKWPENGRDFVVSVNEVPVTIAETQAGYAVLEGLDVSKLNYCARLLSETEPVTPQAKN